MKERCSRCQSQEGGFDTTYYRIGLLCEPCPDSPGLQVILVAGALVFCVGFSMTLTLVAFRSRPGASFATVAIAANHMQSTLPSAPSPLFSLFVLPPPLRSALG